MPSETVGGRQPIRTEARLRPGTERHQQYDRSAAMRASRRDRPGRAPGVHVEVRCRTSGHSDLSPSVETQQFGLSGGRPRYLHDRALLGLLVGRAKPRAGGSRARHEERICPSCWWRKSATRRTEGRRASARAEVARTARSEGWPSRPAAASRDHKGSMKGLENSVRRLCGGDRGASGMRRVRPPKTRQLVGAHGAEGYGTTHRIARQRDVWPPIGQA